MRKKIVFFTSLAVLGAGASAADCTKTALQVQTMADKLDGYEQSVGDHIVYQEGFKVTLSLSQPSARNAAVKVDSVNLLVDSFTAGRQPAYAKQKSLVYGAGPAANMKFVVGLRGHSIGRATWTMGESVATASSENILDLPRHELRPILVHQSNSVELKGTVLAFTAGLYRVKFRVKYLFGGITNECDTSVILVYQNENE